jgi:2-polyprenyl-3-methyl-5-hydroxy-6-metoxy-1,4-benzoquinol methylase
VGFVDAELTDRQPEANPTRAGTLDRVSSSLSSDDRARHWDAAYRDRGASGVSWYQEEPLISLELIEALDMSPTSAVIDVGGGSSALARSLVKRGFLDVTVLDVSQSAIDLARLQGAANDAVTWVHTDVLLWQPDRRFDVWHDRAVFHFLVEPDDREQYLDLLRTVLEPRGAVILGTFAPDGPEFCSGLPVVRYAPDQLATLLGRDFTVERECREEHTTPTGAVQPFTWLMARRTGDLP